MATLKNLQARNISPDDKPMPHGGVTGLTLHPSKTKGQGKWVLRYVSPVTNRRRNAGVGAFPKISIAQAAKIALEMREQIEQGIDPLQEKQAKESAEKPPRFKDAATTYHSRVSSSWTNEKYIKQWLTMLERYAFPVIGDIRLNDIQPTDIENVLRPIWLDKPETGRKVRSRISSIMEWGLVRGYCLSNPTRSVEHLLPKQESIAISTQHHPAMAWKDIPKFVKKHVFINDNSNVTRLLLEFVILTACRSGEARGARWSEIDWDSKTWIIPAERIKMKTEHRVPLSTRAIEILKLQKGIHEEIVFPSPVAQNELTDMVLTMHLRRVKAPSNTQGRFATAHGFRSSFRDWCSENGVSRDLAERSLAHAINNQSEAAYHRTDLLEQRRPLMQKWCDFVTGKGGPKTIDDVFTEGAKQMKLDQK